MKEMEFTVAELMKDRRKLHRIAAQFHYGEGEG